MAFCNKCGTKLPDGSEFCHSCGSRIAGSEPTPPKPPVSQPPDQTQAKAQTQTIAQPPQTDKEQDKNKKMIIWLVIIFFCISSFFFFIFSLIGAQGQPSTVIPPSPASKSKKSISGSSLSIPTNLAADSTDTDISLKWDESTNTSLKKYNIYRSADPVGKYALIGNANSDKTIYYDRGVKKGVAFYYVITAVTRDGAESGNSRQAFAAVELPPLVPEGIYSWADVKARCDDDPRYLKLLTRVTDLTMSDVKRLVRKEKDDMYLKKNLQKNTILTNSTKKYKILPNYRLKTNRVALTDEDGVPHVLSKCGNPMKMQIPVTRTSVFIQTVQIFVTNIIMIFPPGVTNIFINASKPINSIAVAVMPSGVKIAVGTTMAPPPSDVYIDPDDAGSDYIYEGEDLNEHDSSGNEDVHDDSSIEEDGTAPPSDEGDEPQPEEKTKRPKGDPVEVFNNGNVGGVENGGTPTKFTTKKKFWVTELTTYHWNNATGKSPGTIALESADGKKYGPWQATGKPGQGGVPDAYWVVSPNLELPPGNYTVIDSDPASFAQNSGTGGQGMAWMSGIPVKQYPGGG